ncbi:MAG: hypothetical protein ACKO8P_00590 [Actinomycetota bacterium]
MSVQLPMGISERLTRHRLTRCTATLKELREDLRVTREHYEVMHDDAADAELRAIVSETPSAEAVHRESQGHFVAIQRHVTHLEARISELKAEQDALLDALAKFERPLS